MNDRCGVILEIRVDDEPEVFDHHFEGFDPAEKEGDEDAEGVGVA